MHDSCNSDPKGSKGVEFEFSDFGFELQESFDFEIFDFTIPPNFLTPAITSGVLSGNSSFVYDGKFCSFPAVFN